MSTTKTAVQRLIFYEDPACLQNLAAVVAAAQLWRQELVKDDTHVHPMSTTLPLAKSIPGISTKLENLIGKCIEPVRKSALVWLKYHFSRIFIMYENENDVLKKYFDYITWRADCTIDYELTAEKLVACAELGAICKYKVACTYCLEDDIRRLWKELPSTYLELSNVFCILNQMTRYWDCRMKVEEATSTLGGNSMHGKVFDQLDPENWTAWKYCWSRLPADQQIDKAVAMIDGHRDMHRYVRKLLPLLTKLQLIKVLKRCSNDVIALLASSSVTVKHARETWRFVKNFISGESYVKMFVDVLDSNSDVHQRRNLQNLSIVQNSAQNKTMKVSKSACTATVNVSQLLFEIWQDSPDYLRKHLIDKHAGKVLSKLSKEDHRSTLKNLSRDVGLMLELLSRSDYLVNNAFWRKHWIDLIKGVKSTHLGEIMKLCFRHDKDIAKFKKTHMSVYSKIDIYCTELLCQGCFHELNDFLNFCTSDPNVIVGLKKSMLLTMNPIPTLSYCVFNSHDPVQMQAVDDFIADIYADPGRRKNLKCQMVTSITNFKFLQTLVSKGFLIPVKNFITLFLTREAELKDVKKNLLQHCTNILIAGEFNSFNGDVWNEFLLWCVNDDQQRLDQFKQSVSVGDVFRTVFADCLKDIENRFNDFLVREKHVDTFFDNIAGGKCVDKQKPDDDSEADKANSDSEEEQLVNTNGGDSDEALKDLRLNHNYFIDCYQERFDKLSNFLQWYFPSKEEVDAFKLARIKKRGFLDKLTVGRDIRIAIMVLRWVFNRDDDRIRSFVETLKK